MGELIGDCHTPKLSVCVSQEIRYLCVIQGVSAGLGEGLYQGNVVAGVVELSVRISDRTDETVPIQLRHSLYSFVARKVFAGRDSPRTGEPIVNFQPDIEIGHINPVVARN